MPSDNDVDFEPITSISSRSPGYRTLSRRSGGNVRSSIRRAGTPEQQQFAARFPRVLGNLDELRNTIRPGFSQLRQARLNQVSNARSRGIGSLRENLRQRRVAGSSFANDAIARAEAEFGQQAAEQEAVSFLEELQANQQVLQQESGMLFEALNRELAELGAANQFASSSADLFSRDQMFATQLALQEAQAEGQFWGDIAGLALGVGLGALGAPSSSVLGGLLTGGGAAAPASTGFATLGGGSPFAGGGTQLGVGNFASLR